MDLANFTNYVEHNSSDMLDTESYVTKIATYEQTTTGTLDMLGKTNGVLRGITCVLYLKGHLRYTRVIPTATVCSFSTALHRQLRFQHILHTKPGTHALN